MYDQPDRKKILKWEMFGILFIFLFGALLHFVFELSGNLKIMALIGGVNESVWEHIKIGFWPAFIWAIIEFFVWGRKSKNFLIAKGFSFIIIGVFITGIYYLVVSLGIESLPIDITNFFISIAIAQMISYRIILVQRHSVGLNVVGALIILVSIAAFSLLSFFPPECPIFHDPVSGGYGVFPIENMNGWRF